MMSGDNLMLNKILHMLKSWKINDLKDLEKTRVKVFNFDKDFSYFEKNQDK